MKKLLSAFVLSIVSLGVSNVAAMDNSLDNFMAGCSHIIHGTQAHSSNLQGIYDDGFCMGYLRASILAYQGVCSVTNNVSTKKLARELFVEYAKLKKEGNTGIYNGAYYLFIKDFLDEKFPKKMEGKCPDLARISN